MPELRDIYRYISIYSIFFVVFREAMVLLFLECSLYFKDTLGVVEYKNSYRVPPRFILHT